MTAWVWPWISRTTEVGRFDGETYRIGFIDICDTPYWETIAAVRDVGYRLYNIRAGK